MPPCISKPQNPSEKQILLEKTSIFRTRQPWPGTCGCGVSDDDANGNTVPDCLDESIDLCPEDPDKTLPGICGCGVPDDDVDGDGIYACHDKCDEDPDKIKEGACGCGIADVDSDGDGTLDCNERCPQDPNKTEAGTCGCGYADDEASLADDDGDGTVNCLDLCPQNPIKTEPGQGSCDWLDTDGDLVEDKDDACIYNPKVHEAGKDCNYIKDEDGNEVFEIWTAADLKRLKSEMDKRIPEDRIGFTFTDMNRCNYECISPDASSLYFNYMCEGFNNAYFRVGLNNINTCGNSKTCTYINDVRTCINAGTCHQATEGVYNPNDCCNMDEWNEKSVCHASNHSILHCNGSFLYETACPVGTYCTETGNGAECQSCLGDSVLTGGEANACCNEAEYVKTCSADGSTLYQCVGGKVIHSICNHGCETTADSAVCISTCSGEPVTTGGAPNTCCDVDNYQPTCDGSGIWECVNGFVKFNDCLGTCETNTNEDGVNTAQCHYQAPQPFKAFKVRLMRDIDLNEAYPIDRHEGKCMTDHTSIDLYRAEFIGNGHTIRFTSQDERCAITRPLFDHIMESSIDNLNLDFDMHGQITSALARIVNSSAVKNIGWNGKLSNSKFSIYGEKASNTSLLASYARDSVFENIKQTGSIQNRGIPYYGLIGYMDHTNLKDVDIQLSELSGHGLTTTLSYQMQNISALSDVTLNIDNVNLYSVFYGGLYRLDTNCRAENIDLRIANINTSSTFTAFINYNYGIIKNITFTSDVIKSSNTPLYGFVHYNEPGAVIENADITLKEVKAYSTIYGFGVRNSGTIQNLTLSSDKVESLNSAIYGVLSSNNANAVIQDVNITLKEAKAYNAIYGFSNSNDGTILNLTLSSDKVESVNNAIYGVVSSNSANAVVEDVNITLKEVKASSAIYGFASSNAGTVKNLTLSSDKFESLNNNIYGVLSNNNTNAVIQDANITLKEVKASGYIYGFASSNDGTVKNMTLSSDKFESVNNAIYGVISSNNANAVVEDVNITIKEIKPHTIYYGFSIIRGKIQNMSIHVDELWASDTRYIAGSASNCTIDNMAVHYGKIHVTSGKAIGIHNPWQGAQISNLAVYADIYIKQSENNNPIINPLFWYDDTSSGISTYKNIASSIRVQNYADYDAETNSYTELTPYLEALCFDHFDTSNHETKNFYYMVREFENSAITKSDYTANDIFTPFTKEGSRDTVDALNDYAEKDIWELKDVVEDNITIQIPWLKDNNP